MQSVAQYLVKNISVADVAAAGSIGTASWTWLANVNGVLQLIATTIAIIAGGYAIAYHREKIRGIKERPK